MEFTTIDPLDKKVTFDKIPITGWGEGKKFEVSITEEDFKLHVGTDGDVTRIIVRKDVGEILLFLSEGSATNAALSARRQIDLTLGTAAGPLTVIDKGGQTIVTVKKAWIKGAPKIIQSDVVEIREWTLSLAGLRGTFYVGGANA